MSGVAVREREVRGTFLTIAITLLPLELTPSQEQKEPQFLGESGEDYPQHEIEHDSLTQHPAEHSQEEIVQ